MCLSVGLPARSDINRSAQSQKKAVSLECQIYVGHSDNAVHLFSL